MTSPVGEEFNNTPGAVMERSGLVVGPEAHRARQMLLRLRRRGGGKAGGVEAGSEE